MSGSLSADDIDLPIKSQSSSAVKHSDELFNEPADGDGDISVMLFGMEEKKVK